MEANMIFKTIRFYDIKSRHGLPKAELQRYWANARLHKVIVILNIITIIMIIIVITAVIIGLHNVTKTTKSFYSRVISGFTKFKQKLDLKALPQVKFQ